jgi:site-specific DNA-methyltransferase (adenine-specific)
LKPYWSADDVKLYLGDCLDVLRTLEADSIDAIVTDPPGAVRFMGREWDSDRGGRAQWVAWLAGRMSEALRVLKPGGHLLVWSLPRTSHWTAWALEDAGLEIRDCILHLFGSGFPKSLDVSKAIDRMAGAEREVVGQAPRLGGPRDSRPADCTQSRDVAYRFGDDRSITAPGTEDAARWEGWGTALKPGQEMWWLARKPLKGTVAASVLEFGTGALNIDGCKVGTTRGVPASLSRDKTPNGVFGEYGGGDPKELDPNMGRWPANIVFTHSAACDGVCAPDCPAGELDRQSGVQRDGVAVNRNRDPGNRTSWYGTRPSPSGEDVGYGGSGGASRYFPVFRYQAKAPASERPRLEDGTAHETVKPLGLTSWQVRLITPPGGTVLDLFAGSGPVGEACIIEGFRCVLIEQDRKSADLIRKRLSKPIQPVMFGLEG